MSDKLVVFDAPLGRDLQDLARNKTTDLLGKEATVDNVKPNRRAEAADTIPRQQFGQIILYPSGTLQMAYNPGGEIAKGRRLSVFWSDGDEVRGSGNKGQWEIHRGLNEDDQTFGYDIRAVSCDDCYAGTVSDACAAVGCCRINEIRTTQFAIYLAPDDPFAPGIYWEEASTNLRFYHVENCIWETKTFAWFDPDACDARYKYVLNRPLRKMTLELASGTPCKALQLEWEFVEEERFIKCLCSWWLKNTRYNEAFRPTPCDILISAKVFPPLELFGCNRCTTELEEQVINFPREVYADISKAPPQFGYLTGTPSSVAVEQAPPGWKGTYVLPDDTPIGLYPAFANFDPDPENEGFDLCNRRWAYHYISEACEKVQYVPEGSSSGTGTGSGTTPYDQCADLGYPFAWSNGLIVWIYDDLLADERRFKLKGELVSRDWTLGSPGPSEFANFESDVWYDCELLKRMIDNGETFALPCVSVGSLEDRFTTDDFGSLAISFLPKNQLAAGDGKDCEEDGSGTGSGSGSGTGTDDSGTGDSGTGTGGGTDSGGGGTDTGGGTDSGGTGTDSGGGGTGTGSGGTDSGGGGTDSGGGTGSGGSGTDSGTGTSEEPTGACCFDGWGNATNCLDGVTNAQCQTLGTGNRVFTPDAACGDVECGSGSGEDCDACHNASLTMDSLYGGGNAIVTAPMAGLRRWVWDFVVEGRTWSLFLDCTGTGDYVAALFIAGGPCHGYQTFNSLTVVDCDPLSITVSFTDCLGGSHTFFCFD